MWKVLGDPTVMIKAGDVWEEKLFALSKKKKGSERFRELMSEAEIVYRFDPMAEVHCFFVQMPTKTEMEELEFLKDFILKLHKGAKVPVIEFNDEPQKFTIVLTAESEKDIHEMRKEKREKGGEEEMQSIG